MNKLKSVKHELKDLSSLPSFVRNFIHNSLWDLIQDSLRDPAQGSLWNSTIKPRDVAAAQIRFPLTSYLNLKNLIRDEFYKE